MLNNFMYTVENGDTMMLVMITGYDGSYMRLIQVMNRQKDGAWKLNAEETTIEDITMRQAQAEWVNMTRLNTEKA